MYLPQGPDFPYILNFLVLASDVEQCETIAAKEWKKVKLLKRLR